MNWIGFALSSYFLGAVAVVFDKYLLGSKRIPSAHTYAFFVGIFSIGVAIIIPVRYVLGRISLSLPDFFVLIGDITGGVLFIAGLYFFYAAIRKAQASRVAPIYFSIIPIATFIFSTIMGRNNLTLVQIIGVAVLIGGGLLIAFDLPLREDKRTFFNGLRESIFAGIISAASFLILSNMYVRQDFFEGFLWSRFGMFFGALLFLIVPLWRKDILNSFRQKSVAEKKKAKKTGALFVANKVIGGTSSILLNKALQLGGATLTNALFSVQYIFILIIAAVFMQKQPDLFDEAISVSDWIQKISAIAMIGIGTYLIY